MFTRDELASATPHVLLGLYFGTVEDVDDPEKLGRVRIRVHQYHSTDYNSAPTNRLPWAPLLGFGGFTGHGVYWTPVVGSQVIVGFLMGSPDRPICLGTAYGRGEAPAEVSGRAAGTPSNSPFGTDAFTGSNAAGTATGAPKTHVLRTPGGRQIVMDDAAESLILESDAGHIIGLTDKSGEVRLEMQSTAPHNLTFWDEAGAERAVITSSAGHSTTWDDRPADPNILHETAGGHIIKMTDKASGPEIRLETPMGHYLSLAHIGFGGAPEIRLQTPSGAHLVMQDASDTLYCTTAGAAGLLAVGSGYALLGTATGYRVDVGGVSNKIAISTPSSGGSVEVSSTGQTNIKSKSTVTISADISITLSAPVINLN